LIFTGLVLLLVWQNYSKRSTDVGGGVDMNQFGPTIQLIIDNALNRNLQDFSTTLMDKVDNHARIQVDVLGSNKEAVNERMNEFKSLVERSMLEELGKIQQLQTQSLHQNKTEFEKHTQVAQQNLSDIKISNLQSLNDLKTDVSKQLKDSILELNTHNKEKLDEIRGNIDKRMNESLEKNLESFGVVKENLGKMQMTAEKMIKSSESIDKLNNVFASTASKSTGNFAENYLETILKEQLNTRHWNKQVPVPGEGGNIDFVVSMGDTLGNQEVKRIGIDSKFPLTSYQNYIDATLENKEAERKNFLRGVRNMGKELSKKYLKPDFIDVLLMYLPSDSMYNEVVNDLETAETLQRANVTPISPTTIFPLILIIKNYEMKIKINEEAEQILEGLKKVALNVDSFRDQFKKLGDKLRQAQTNFDQADRSLLKMSDNVARLHRDDNILVNETEGESLVEVEEISQIIQ
jgi:DNA recombination protein RmuC